MKGQVCAVTLDKDNVDHWVCETPTGSAMLISSLANDYPDSAEFLASMIPNKNPHGPKWFINCLAPIDTPVTELTGIQAGYDPYFNLLAKARLCRKIIDLSDRNKVWYAGLDVDYYLEEYQND